MHISKRVTILLLLCIFLLGFFLRVYKLDSVPLGLNIDETAIGYNAYSILQTGKDEYGISYPLYFKSFNDHKLPVYIYSTAAAIQVFGMTPFAVRFLSFFFGSLTILTIFFLVYFLSKRKDVALLASFLLAINPWHFFFSRVAFEVNVAISLLTLGMTLFVFALEKKKYMMISLLAGVTCFVLAMYCYNVTRILSPLLFISLVVYYRKPLRKMDIKSLFVLMLFWGISLLPFLITLFKTSGISTQQSVLIFGGQHLANYIELRSYVLSLPMLLSKLLFNTPVQIGWEYLKNIVSFFSVDFFFLKGAHHPINGVGTFGMFHLLEFLTIPLGVYLVIKKRMKYLYVIVVWTVVVILLASITNEIPHPTRTYGVLIPFIIFSAFGLGEILSWVMKIDRLWFKRIGILAISLFFTYSSIYYFSVYFLKFPREHAATYRAADEELVAYLTSQEKNYNKIVIDEDADFAYTSLLFYKKYSPEQYHQRASYTMHGQLQILQKLDKYEYRKIQWEEDKIKPNTLFIMKKTTGFGMSPIKTITYPEHPVVLFYDNKLGVFPAADVAYELYRYDRK